MAVGRVIVEKSIAKLKSSLTDEDTRMFSDTTLGDIWQEARSIEQEQAGRMDLRFVRRIEPFLRSLDSYAGVFDVFCQGYSPMAWVWGPIKLMLLLARHYTSIIEDILQAFSDIAIVLPRIDRLKTTFRDDTDLHQALGLIYSDIIEFFQRAYKFFRCKGWHFWFTINWGLFERRFRSILQSLSSHCDLLDREAASVHFSEMRRFRDKHQLELEAFERHRGTQMADNVFRLLSAVEDDQEEHLHRLSDDRQPETCNWVLEDPITKKWIEDEDGDSVVWMTGIPGSGKSFLCSLIIQHLQTRHDTCCLYYFCGNRYFGGNRSSTTDSSTLMLRTLAMQLLRQNPEVMPLVHQTFLQNMSSCSLPALRKMLSQVLPNVKYTRIIVDGIDEDEITIQQGFLKVLLEIQRNADHGCKILISSREEPQIQKSLLPKTHLRLAEKTLGGLSLYIGAKAKEVREHFSEINPAALDPVEQRLHSSLHSKAKGMFLWVRLVTAMLIQQATLAELESAIDQLPEGLDKAYGQIIQRIGSLNSAPRDRVFRILYWVCVAYRPVKIQEVADGIVLHPGQTTLSKKTRSGNLDRDIVQLCAPLLEQSSTGVLDLVHFSAREYLIDKQSGPFINVAQAHLSIALSCIINLTTSMDLVPRYRDYDTDTETKLETRVVQGTYGLQSYGHEFWAEHTVAYLAQVEGFSIEESTLANTLRDFAPIGKHESESAQCRSHTGEVAKALNKLRKSPALYNLVSGWLFFKSNLYKAISELNDLKAQQQRRLLEDETYLSLIDSRLCTITERLLSMQPCELPPHINSEDHVTFVGRFGFPCRFLACSHYYDSMQDRDIHETSHIPSFPCLQCDFAERGFASRKDLDRHVRRYHLSPDDFEVPPDLLTADVFPRGGNWASRRLYGLSHRPTCWSAQGRMAVQQGFRQVLDKIQSEVDSATDMAKRKIACNPVPQGSVDTEAIQPAERASPSMDLGAIRDKVETQQYETLTEMKYDLRALFSTSGVKSGLFESGKVESLCELELERATTGYPAFTSLRHIAIELRNDIDSSSIQTIHNDQSEEITDPEDGHEIIISPLGTFSCVARTPYWSETEKKEFPRLLQRYGRDFVEIASYLKTKTVDEIDRYFRDLLRSERKDLRDMADSADSRLRHDSNDVGSVIHIAAPRAASSEPSNVAHNAQSQFLQPPQSCEVLAPYTAHLKDSSTEQRMLSFGSNPQPIHVNLEHDDVPKGLRTKKRKPRQRVLCSQCTQSLHDEYALIKHVDRFHKATRKVWVCEDISIDKQFLADCKACVNSKRYSCWSIAGKHLRQAHFAAETPPEAVRRWTRETEEPNPNYQSPGMESSSITRPTTKRQKTQAQPFSLRPVLGETNSSRILPSMLALPEHGKLVTRRSSPNSPSASDNDKDDEEKGSPSPSLSNHDHSLKDVYLADVSFDNILPGFTNNSSLVDGNGPPHRANRALIKPDQVSRLPHLIPFRKRACQDQVEALHQRLDREVVGSERYKKDLEKLTSLSRSLMSNLRDWRRHSTLAPTLPFSV